LPFCCIWRRKRRKLSEFPLETQELKFFAILLHLKKKKKTEWVPTPEVSVERMHSIEGKGLSSRGRMNVNEKQQK
jgi:hypothetical protein